MPSVHYSSSYIDVPADPQFFFGHGLSFSRFTLHDLHCNPGRFQTDESVEISVGVANESEVDGEATLFLFVRDVVASVARPLLELKRFQKVALAARARRRLEWRLSAADFRFIGPNLDSILEPGQFQVSVGQSADPARLHSGVIELVR